MEITSLHYFFFVIGFLLTYQVNSEANRKYIVLTFSLFFYGTYSLFLLGSLIASILFNYFNTYSRYQFKKELALIFNIGLLGFYKLDHDNSLIIPIGISFFTFQALGFFFDNKDSTKKVKLVDFAIFLSFFPQLIAGPIERFSILGKQLQNLKKIQFENLLPGVRLILIGLVSKVVLADRINIITGDVYNNLNQANFFSISISTTFFLFQSLLDFSAYTIIAKGIAKLIGIELSSNFNKPYFAKSLSQYWRRWHISLHKWFNRYVFQNVYSKSNLFWAAFVVFILSGIWHGFKWNFLFWGLFSFLTFVLDYYIIQKFIKNGFLRWLSTFSSLIIAAGLFLAKSWEEVKLLFSNAFNFDTLSLKTTLADFYYVITNYSEVKGYKTFKLAGQEINLSYNDLAITIVGLIIWLLISLKTKKSSNIVLQIVTLFLVVCLFGFQNQSSFIYFQF